MEERGSWRQEVTGNSPRKALQPVAKGEAENDKKR
jgi:hypothetical protein